MEENQTSKTVWEEYLAEIGSEGEEVIFQLRQFHDKTWSVMARVWTPQKKFYEHPTLINLTQEAAQLKCEEIIQKPPSVSEITQKWLLIAD